MANRAYLWSGDRNDEKSTEPYYDSRHNIPLAWWFLFEERDISLVHKSYWLTEKNYEMHWREVRFLAAKPKALAAFNSRKPLLLEIVGQDFDITAIEVFYKDLCNWPGPYLLMDPTEVLQGEHFEYEPCLRIARSIHTEYPVVGKVVASVSVYSQTTFDDQEKFDLNVVGYTYW